MKKEGVDKAHRIIIILLILAILFSLVSILINFSVFNFNFSPGQRNSDIKVGGSSGEVSFYVEESANAGGGNG